MKPEVAEVRKLVEEIQDIETEIYQLEERKMRAEYRLGELVIAKTTSVASNEINIDKARRGRVASETSAKKVVANYLSKYPEGNFTAEVVAEVTQMNLGTVRTNLSRLVREGVIEKRSFNTYGALKQEKEASEEAPMIAELSF